MRIRSVILGAAAAATAAYLFDQRRGRSRRLRLVTSLRSRVGHPATTIDHPDPLPENVAPAGPIDDERHPAAGSEPSKAEAPVPEPHATERVIREFPPKQRATIPATASTSQDDAEIVRSVRGKLEERRDLQTDDLVVDVVAGVAYLSGDLRDRQTFGEIVDLTRDTPGVVRVQSLLHLPHSDTITPSSVGTRSEPDRPSSLG